MTLQVNKKSLMHFSCFLKILIHVQELLRGRSVPYIIKPFKRDPKVNMLNSFTVVYSQEELLFALNEDYGNSAQTPW